MLTISLTRYKAGTILPAFVDLLSALPNLQTIEFVHVHSQMASAIGLALRGKSFPSVKTLVLPTCAHELLPRCPNVEDVTCNEDSGGLITTSIQAGHCVNIVKLLGVKLSPVTLKRAYLEICHEL